MHTRTGVRPCRHQRIKELWNAASKKHAETGDSSCRGHNSHAILPSIFPSLSLSLLFSFSPPSPVPFIYRPPFAFPSSSFAALGGPPTTSEPRRSRPQIDRGYIPAWIKRNPEWEGEEGSLVKNRECRTTMRRC